MLLRRGENPPGAGYSVTAQWTDRHHTSGKEVNVRLTKEILKRCAAASLTDQIFFNTSVCRFLDTLLTQKGFTGQDLINLAKRFALSYPWSLDYAALKSQPNERFVFFPLIIAFPHNTEEVVFWVALAQCHHMTLSIRSGGHSAEGYSSAGELLIDLSTSCFCCHARFGDCPQLRIDPVQNILEMTAGVPLGVLYTELAKVNRITPLGTCPGVSSGLVVGGGVGPLARKYGLSCDQLVSVEIVLADGEVLVLRDDDPLFVGIKGAGTGNFGVVTSLTMNVFDLCSITYYSLTWNLHQFKSKQIGKVLTVWHNCFLNEAPQEVMSSTVRISTGLEPTLSITGWFEGSPQKLANLLKTLWLDFVAAPTEQSIDIITILEAATLLSGSQPQIQPFYFAHSSFSLCKTPKHKFTQVIRFMKHQRPFEDVNDGQSVIVIEGFGKPAAVNDPALLKTSVFPTRSSIAWHLNNTFYRLQSLEAQAFAFSRRMDQILTEIFFPLAYYNWQDATLLKTDYLHRYFDGGHHVPFLRCLKEQYDPHHVFSFPLGISQNGSAKQAL